VDSNFYETERVWIIMKKAVIVLFCIGVTVTGCEYNNVSNCCHGRVIMTSCCTGSTFISLDSSAPIGKNTKLNGQDYSNVIQVPGYLSAGNIYLNLRKFDPDKDSNLFPPMRCYCLIAVGAEAPIFVTTAVSNTACPKEN
jgi:hypothetical protein